MSRSSTRPARTANISAPKTYGDLRDLLQDRLPHLAAGQQRIARMFLDDPEGAAFHTIGEAAAQAEVHQSSMVRFATMLGLDGYPALVQLCRDQLATRAQLVRRLNHAADPAVGDSLFARVVEHDTRNLSRTFAQIQQADWDAVVHAIVDAPHVHVVGLRKCFSVAHLAAYLLHMVRPGVDQLTGDAGLLVDGLREIRHGDVLIAVSINRYTRDTVRVMEYAKSVDLTTIALTDNASSPLARSADHTFYVETGGVTIFRSLSAFTSLVQALATAVAIQAGTRVRDELLTDEQLLERFEVYLEPADSSRGHRDRSGKPANS